MLWPEGLKNLVHASLVLVHGPADPHVVVVTLDAVLRRERWQRCEFLQKLEFVGELVLNENAALGGSEVGPSLSECLLVEELVDDADAGSAFNGYANHTRHVVQVSLCEAFGAIERVDPDDQVVLVELIWELKLVAGSLRCFHSVDVFHILQVAPIPALLLLDVVVQQELPADVVHIQLVGFHVRRLGSDLVLDLVFLANDLGPWVQLLKVVNYCVLNMHVCLCEDVTFASALQSYTRTFTHLSEDPRTSTAFERCGSPCHLPGAVACIPLADELSHCLLTERNSLSFTTFFIRT